MVAATAGVTAVASIQSLAPELPHAVDVPKKKKKRINIPSHHSNAEVVAKWAGTKPNHLVLRPLFAPILTALSCSYEDPPPAHFPLPVVMMGNPGLTVQRPWVLVYPLSFIC